MDEAVVKRFLNYSFKDINFDYDGLTDTEKGLATREEFERLASWVQGGARAATSPSSSQSAENAAPQP